MPTLLKKLVRHLPLDSKLLVSENKTRNPHLNRQLALSLAFVAGAANAGGFLALRFYTSHVTGSLSKIADSSILGDFSGAWEACLLVAAFIAGAFSSETLIHFGKRARFKGPYAFSLALQSGLLVVFGFMGDRQEALPFIALLLSFSMGMLNAVVTSISGAEVRVTHMTGNATDFGVELSRLFHRNSESNGDSADKGRLKLLSLLLGFFLIGAFSGAWGFKRFGFGFSWFLSAFLLLLAFRPLRKDFVSRWKMYKLKRRV